MPLYVNDLCIGLHSKCNWKCKYCVARWDKSEIDEVKILNELIPFKDKLNKLWLSGGEPGLLSVQFWDYLFYESNYPLSICTNGTFITRGYANRYKSKICRLMIHCVEELDQIINPHVLKFIQISPISKIVNIVIHKNNTHLLHHFLSEYSNIQFELNFADQSFVEINNQYQKKYDCVMDRDAVIETITQLGKFKNYSRYTNFLTKKLIQNDFKHLNPWSNKNHD